MTSKIQIHNVDSGQIIERDMTALELEQLAKDTIEANKVAEAAVAAKNAKAALLEKLGITEDEAKLLLS
jgi:hypothetical protein